MSSSVKRCGCGIGVCTYVALREGDLSDADDLLENDYYILAGRLIGERESGVTVFLLTDELGSVLTSLSAVAGSAAVTSNQVYSPYGSPRYRKGTAPTTKGFTGQYHDGSGLDYYHARYYDPMVGRFVSADIKQGNGQGMDPYSYVGNNPETKNDPTGQRACNPSGGQCGSPCGGNCSPDPDPPVNCHGGGPRACTSGGTPPSRGGCHPGISASATCNDWYVKHALPAFKKRMDDFDSLIRGKQIIGYTMMILADIILALSIKNPIKWLQLIIEFGGMVGRLWLPALIRQFAGGGAVYEAAQAFAAAMSRIVGVAEGLLGALRAQELWAQWTVIVFMSSTLLALGPAQVTARLVLTIVGPLIGGLLDAGANWVLAWAQDDLVQETHEKNMDIIQWCAQYGNGACGTPP